jgi:hypothetical protein
MHYHVRAWQFAVDLFNPGHHQYFAGWLLRKLVSAVAGADRDGQGVNAVRSTNSTA